MEKVSTGTDTASGPGLLSFTLDRRRFLGLSVVAVGGLSGCTAAEAPLITEPLPDCKDTPANSVSQQFPAEGIHLAGHEMHMPGIAVRNQGLRVEPLPRTLLKQGKDGAPDVYNRVLPFYPDLHFDSDSRSGRQIQAQLNLDPGSSASVLAAESLPVQFDEFEFPGRGLRVTVNENGGGIDVWDGIHDQPSSHTFTLPAGSSRDIRIIQQSGTSTVTVNGQEIQSIPYQGKRLWIGLEADGGGFDVGKLTIAPLSNQRLSATSTTSLTMAPCKDGLRSIKRRNPDCMLGTAVAVNALMDNDQYRALVAGEFDMITLENAMKPGSIQPQEGVFTPQEALRGVQFAERHDMAVHMHTLFPNRSMGEWMYTLPTETSAQRAYVSTVVMPNHIAGALQPFPRFHSIDVVNEALDGVGWRDTLWHRTLGDKFIDLAFHTTREVAGPGPILIINDNATDKAGDYDEARFMMLLKKLIALKRQGLQRLGMGFEGHVYTTPNDNMSPADLERRMGILQNHGFYARVSEMDVTTHYNGSPDTTEEGLRLQAQQYGEIARVCMKMSNCIAFSLWGVGGKYASTSGINGGGKLVGGSNLLWDRQFRQRAAAYTAVREALAA